MEDRFALLIDADNVSAKYIKPILDELSKYCLLYTSPSPRDPKTSRMPSSA